jgi:hypothetical protein
VSSVSVRPQEASAASEEGKGSRGPSDCSSLFRDAAWGGTKRKTTIVTGKGALQDLDRVGVDVTCKACGCSVVRGDVVQSAEEGALCLRVIDHQGVTKVKDVFTLVIIHYIFAHVLSLSYKTARKL